MSYILDALRKSDQQRHRGVTPTLLAPQATEPPRPHAISASQGLLVAVLIGIGIAIGALRPWHSEETPPVSVATANKPHAASAPPSASAPAASPVQPEPPRSAEPSVPEREAAPVTPPPASKPAPRAQERKANTAAKTEPAARPKAPSVPPKPTAVAQKEKEAAKPAAQEQRDAPAPAAAVPEQKTVPITELPPSVRDEMPKMSVTVHAYSREPRDRLVGINDRVLREGESVAPGLTLEQITPDGLIMSYKGYRFQRGVR